MTKPEGPKGYVAHKFVVSGSGNECAACGASHGGDSATWVPDAPTPPPVTRLDEITERARKVSGKDGFFYIPDFEEHAHEDIPYLLTELQKVEADRNRYIQRAGSAEGRLEIVEAELTALRQENARLTKSLAAADAYFPATALEVVNLRQENARLKGALANIATALDDAQIGKAGLICIAALSPSPAQEQK